jgi:transposase
VKKGKKNDAADAAAICEAASRPNAKFGPAKAAEQQGILTLHAARSLLVNPPYSHELHDFHLYAA